MAGFGPTIHDCTGGIEEMAWMACLRTHDGGGNLRGASSCVRSVILGTCCSATPVKKGAASRSHDSWWTTGVSV